ncbi:MAG: YqaJ viral recombinase family protein [Chloroflexi bacterium]|nr:YqaJ viral recombinase family protein [Chloroflexota bacterium]
MTAAIALPYRQGTPAWVDARHDVIGSSDIPILTGNSPYRTSLFSLWAVKSRLAEPEPVDDETQELFDLGHALEDVIARRYEAHEQGRPVRRVTRLLVHPEHRWRGASLDRVSARKGERRIVEVKWVPHRYWRTDGPEPVPAHVQDQVQWQLMVTGYDVADVAVLNGSHIEVHQVEPSQRYQDDLVYIARDFWDHVEKGQRPPIDGSDSTADTIRRLRPRDTLGLMDPTPEVAALAMAIREASRAARAAGEEDKRLRNEMRWLLDQHAGVEGVATVEDHEVGYRIHFRRGAEREVRTTDWEAVARAYRHLLEGEPMPAGMDLDSLAALHTTTEVREGTRTLRPMFRDDDTGRWV